MAVTPSSRDLMENHVKDGCQVPPHTGCVRVGPTDDPLRTKPKGCCYFRPRRLRKSKVCVTSALNVCISTHQMPFERWRNSGTHGRIFFRLHTKRTGMNQLWLRNGTSPRQVRIHKVPYHQKLSSRSTVTSRAYVLRYRTRSC